MEAFESNGALNSGSFRQVNQCRSPHQTRFLHDSPNENDALHPQPNHREPLTALTNLGGHPFPRAILSRVIQSTTHTPVIAIVGPTASGKSTLGIEVALKLNGEIINCDSVQVYQEIQIATAKVPLAERKGVPHHLIDFVSPNVNYTAVDWAREAEAKIEEIEGRGRIPLLVGGTGFYLRALSRPLFASPQTDESLRQRLNLIREKHGPEHLHRLLARLDPQAAGQLFPRDWPRVQRAIEVFLQTGQSIVDQQQDRPEPHESSRRLRI